MINSSSKLQRSPSGLSRLRLGSPTASQFEFRSPDSSTRPSSSSLKSTRPSSVGGGPQPFSCRSPLDIDLSIPNMDKILSLKSAVPSGEEEQRRLKKLQDAGDEAKKALEKVKVRQARIQEFQREWNTLCLDRDSETDAGKLQVYETQIQICVNACEGQEESFKKENYDYEQKLLALAQAKDDYTNIQTKRALAGLEGLSLGGASSTSKDENKRPKGSPAFSVDFGSAKKKVKVETLVSPSRIPSMSPTLSDWSSTISGSPTASPLRSPFKKHATFSPSPPPHRSPAPTTPRTKMEHIDLPTLKKWIQTSEGTAKLKEFVQNASLKQLARVFKWGDLVGKNVSLAFALLGKGEFVKNPECQVRGIHIGGTEEAQRLLLKKHLGLVAFTGKEESYKGRYYS